MYDNLHDWKVSRNLISVSSLKNYIIKIYSIFASIFCLFPNLIKIKRKKKDLIFRPATF